MPRPTLFDHPKFQRLAQILQMPRPHVLGHLEFLWRVGYSSGNDVIGDEIDVELAAEWHGDRGVLVHALTDPAVRLLDQTTDGRFAIHDFHHHAPNYVKDRWRKEQQRKKLGRKNCPRTRRGLSRDSPGTVRVVSHPPRDLRADLSATPAPAPAPAPSLRTGASAPADRPPDPDLDTGHVTGRDVGAFVRRFCELYAQYRHGARYLVKKAKDIPHVRLLLLTYPRDRLEKLTVVLLTTDDEWVAGTDRGIGILTVKASWLDGLLAGYEAQHGAIQVA